MKQTTEPPDEQPDSGATERVGVERRLLLKALGAGATLSVGASLGSAAQTDAGAQDADGDQSRLDPVFGYATTTVENLPEELSPDHEVDMLIAPPAGPNQPPLFYFEPVGLHIDAGDIVQFTARSPDHSVTAYHPGIGISKRRVPEGSVPFSSPILGPGGAWVYQFDTEGVHDMYCGPHHLFGMVMRIVVGDLTENDVPDYGTSVEGLPTKELLSKELNALSEQNQNAVWPFVTPAEVIGAEPLAPMNLQDAGAVPFSTVAEALGYELQLPQTPPQGSESSANQTSANQTSSN